MNSKHGDPLEGEVLLERKIAVNSVKMPILKNGLRYISSWSKVYFKKNNWIAMMKGNREQFENLCMKKKHKKCPIFFSENLFLHFFCVKIIFFPKLLPFNHGGPEMKCTDLVCFLSTK